MQEHRKALSGEEAGTCRDLFSDISTCSEKMGENEA